jgi:hypothetical protein
MNRKLLFALVLSVCCLGIMGQSHQVFSTSGASFKQSSGYLTHTIGEVMTATLISPGQILTQGFLQTKLKSGGTPAESFPAFQMSVYPNPVNDLLMIKVEMMQGLQYTLHDVTGVLIEQRLITEEETEIDFRSLSPAIYILRVFDNNQQVRIFQIVKH